MTKKKNSSFVGRANELLASSKQDKANDSIKGTWTPSLKWREDGSAEFTSPPFESDRVTPTELLEHYNLSAEDWFIKDLKIDSEWKNIRDPEDPDEIISRFVHKYKGSFALIKEEKEAQAVNWSPYRTPSPAKISFKKVPPKKKTSGVTTTMILPDPQIGFGHMPDGSFYTLHSLEAISLCLNAARIIQPDRIINVGDFMDLAELSTKYLNPEELNKTLQATLEASHRFLAMQTELAPNVEAIEGNHEKRLNDLLLKFTKQLLGVRQAGTPDGWPVLSFPHLLDTDGLGVEWHTGYPGAKIALRQDLVVMHGEKLSAKKQADSDFLFNTVFGHIHRMEVQSKTFKKPEGTLNVLHVSPGSLCRNSGEVPSFHSSVDSAGKPNGFSEDWQQGFCVLKYTDEIESPIEVDLYPIVNNECLVDGQMLTPDEDIMNYLGKDALDTANKVTTASSTGVK